MQTRLLTAVVWLLVAASVFAWARRFTEPLPAATAPATGTATAYGDAVPDPGAAAWIHLLGGSGADSNPALAPPGDSARFQLLGVIADAADLGRGVALIAVDQQAARAYRVGAQVDGDWLLQSVGTRTASLGGQQGAARLTLALPSPMERSTGAPAPVPVALALAAQPQVRMAAPGEMVAPGRRRRLQSRGTGQAPVGPEAP